MMEARMEEKYYDKCFEIFEDLKAAQLRPDHDV